LSSNKVGARRFGNRYKADNVEGDGRNRSGDRNKNRAGNVKETGKEQDSGHFTDEERSKKLKFLGHDKIRHLKMRPCGVILIQF